MWRKVLAIISSGILTFVMTINYAVYISYEGYTGSDYQVNIHYAIAAVLIMIPVYIYLFIKKNFLEECFLKHSRKVQGISIVISFFAVLQLKCDVEKNWSHILTALGWNMDMPLVIWLLCASAGIGIYLFVCYAVWTVGGWGYRFFQSFTYEEKLFFVVSLAGCLSLVCYFYARTDACWNTVDLVYQADPYFVYDHYYPVFSFGYDFDWDIGNGGIRHPLATVILFPIHIFVSFLSNLCFGITNIRPVLYAFAESAFMIMTAIMIKRIVGSQWIYGLFVFSFPFTFFTVFIEKYPISIFLVVLYVYTTIEEKGSAIQKYSLISSGGMMITTSVLGVLYGTETKLAGRIKEYASAVITFFLTLIGTGRIHYIMEFDRLIHQNSVMFYEGALDQNGFMEKFAGFTNLCASSFIPAAYEGTEVNFYWTHLNDKINYFGLFVLVIGLYACIKCRGEKKYYPFIAWFLFSIIQFVIVGFGTGFEPLFSLCHAWAIIPLFFLGISHLVRASAIRKVIFGSLSVIMLYYNYIHMQELLAYLTMKAPLL